MPYPQVSSHSHKCLLTYLLDSSEAAVFPLSITPWKHYSGTLKHTYLQFFELKKSQKYNNDALVPLEKQGNWKFCTQLDTAALLHRPPAQSSRIWASPGLFLHTNTIHPELNSRLGCKVQTHKVFRDPTPRICSETKWLDLRQQEDNKAKT